MTLDELLLAWFCLIDDGMQALLRGNRLRERGPTLRLAYSEVLTMELVGEYLGLNQDTAIFHYFQQHYLACFPGLQGMHRTTFVRQAANLYRVKEQLWHWLKTDVRCEPNLGIVDSIAIAVCQFRRGTRCQRFKGEAGYGRDHLTGRPFYGFRLHARVCWPGIIHQIEITRGYGSELETARDLAEGTTGILLGDRNYWSPRLREDLAEWGITLLAPFRHRLHDPWPQRSFRIAQWRYCIDTVFGQLVDRTQLKRVWARDFWHFCNRLLRKVLMHTTAIWTAQQLGIPSLHLAELVA